MNDWGIVNTNSLHNDAGNQVKLPNVAQTQLFNAVYDPLNRLQEVRNPANTSSVASFAYDALGRRILFQDAKTIEFSRWYYYDGVNEILETTDDGATDLTWYVHGVSYIDERLMMHAEYDPIATAGVDQSFYYALDHMYDVRYLLDATGAIVESYAYDPYGKPLIRECAGRGDLTGDSVISKDSDETPFLDSMNCNIFDPRADIDDDGKIDVDDETLFYVKESIWNGAAPTPVKTARSLVGNPYMFQGRPHFVMWSDYVTENATLMLNDHRNRFADPTTGRWLTRDPIGYAGSGSGLFEMLASNPTRWLDPLGLEPTTSQPDIFDLSDISGALSDAWKKTEEINQGRDLFGLLEVGGNIIEKDGKLAPGKHHLRQDPHHKPFELGEHGYEDGLVGYYHTHPYHIMLLGRSHSGADVFHLTKRSFTTGVQFSIVISKDCTFIMVVEDTVKAHGCYKKGEKYITKIQQDAEDACLERLKKTGKQSECTIANDPSRDKDLNGCVHEGNCAVAKACGLKFYGGCGGNRNKPKNLCK